MKLNKLVMGAVLALSASTAYSAMFTFNGNIENNTDVVRVDFSLANDATNVRVWTDSFLANTTNPDGTNFDPITALWNADTGALLDENDDNESINPSTQTYYDSGFSLSTLTAGNYFFTMAAYNNFAAGSNIADGFRFDGTTPISMAIWDQPANSGNARGTFWQIQLDGVDSATGPTPPVSPSAVPVPGAVWLFGSALAGFVGLGRKKRAELT